MTPSASRHSVATARWLDRAEKSRSRPRLGTGRFDPLRPFMTAPEDRRVGQEAVIRARLLITLTTGSRELVEQRLGFLQNGRPETLGEPTVDRGKQIAGFRTLALVAPQPG
jgi:hypothetical protein